MMSLGRCIAALTLVSATAWAAENVRLVELINKLRDDGHNIVYSSDYVSANTKVQLESLATADIWTLEEQLIAHGLRLRYRSGIWTISPASGLQQAAAGEGEVSGQHTAGMLESVIVTGSRHRLAGGDSLAAHTEITDSDLQNTPALGGDALRIVNRLPGVSSVGVSAKPHIRGGVQDELLILSDGVELLEPFHLADFQSFFSSLDQQTIESIDFYTGGFPVRYGTRISGVMDITPREDFSESGSRVGLSLFSATFNTHGSLHGEGSPNWQLSVRKSVLDQSLRQVNSSLGEPDYGDSYGRLSLPLNQLAWAEQARLALGFIQSSDDIRLSADARDARSQIDSYYFWSRLTADIDQHNSVSAALWTTLEDRQKHGLSEESEASVGSLMFAQKTEKFSLRLDYLRAFEKGRMELGFSTDYASSKYSSTAVIDRGQLALVLGQARFVDYSLYRRPEGFTFGAYASLELPVSDRLWLQPGLRWDRQNYYFGASQQHWSPRLGLRYQASEQWCWQASIGRFYQAQGIHELQLIDGVGDFRRPQRADQAVVGLSWLGTRSHWKAEWYYKRYRHPGDRFENMFNTFVMLPEIEPDRIRVEASEALSRGFDLAFKRKQSEHFDWQLSYSYLDAREQVEQAWIARRWQQRHSLSAIARWQWERWSLSAGLVWHSGWRTSELPESIALGETLALTQLYNNHEQGSFFSVDVSASRRWRWGDRELLLYADLSNLSNRHNIAGLDYAAEVEDQQLVFEREKETLLRMVPNIGFQFTF